MDQEEIKKIVDEMLNRYPTYVDNDDEATDEVECEADDEFDDEDEEKDELTQFIEEHEDECEFDLADYVFRQAIRTGNQEYVSDHAGDFNLSDCDVQDSYLLETEDEEMRDILISAGEDDSALAFEIEENAEDYRFLMNTVNGEILQLSDDLQWDAYEACKEKYGYTDDDILRIIRSQGRRFGIEWIPDSDPNHEILNDLLALGATFEDDELSFDTPPQGGEFTRVLGNLGFSCDAIESSSPYGDAWGYCFIE